MTMLCSLLAAPLAAQALIPAPREMTRLPGELTLHDSVVIVLQSDTPRLREIAAELAGTLEHARVSTRMAGVANSTGTITLRSGGASGDESYRLVIDSGGIVIDAPADAGTLWGVQTLRQLIGTQSGSIHLGATTIHDAPLYPWRGSMLDVGRHFFPVEHILTHLDWMSRHKLNVFHWHLTEDQGWRIQIDALPRLTTIGAHRIEADGTRYGGFYTKADVRRVVERARQLGITVVPEIEMPGHARAAIAAYPHLGCTGDSLPVPTTWGVFSDVMCPGKESTFTFIETVLSEVLELFPSRYIHIGGDEVPKDRWKNCASCQEIIRRENLDDEHGLQRWMIARVGRWLAERDRKLIGWDEIIDGGLPEGATVQAWQSSDRIAAALALGADVIASPSEWLYLNRQASELPLERVARFDPSRNVDGARPVDRPVTRSGRILGIEAPLWTEHVTSAANAELMWWPRLLAVAEVAWHGAADTSDLMERVGHVSADMRAAGVAVGPGNRALVSMRFRYDSATRSVRIAHESMPGVRVSLVAPGRAAREVRDGDSLPGAGAWQLVAHTSEGRVGEARTILSIDHLARGRPVQFATPADARYPGTGPHTLVDGVRGTTFNDGFWNGWWGSDLDAAIDLGGVRPVTAVSLSLLEQVNSWIVYPDTIELHQSQDGSSWRVVQRKALNRPVVADASSRDLVSFDVPAGLRTRWIRVVARGGKQLPAWHAGAGQPAWIFADEIVVK